MSPVLILATIVYETFLGILLLAVGGGVIVSITAASARFLDDKRYSAPLAVFSSASAALFAVSSALLILGIELADNLNPTPAMLLPYLFSVWSVPLTITLLLLFLSTGLMFLYSRVQSRPSDLSDQPLALRPSLLVGSAALTGCLALLFFNLLNSYMLTPNVPLSLPVVVQAGSLAPLTDLGLMVNPSWIPLSIKLLLVGCVGFAILFSGAAAIRRMSSTVRDEEKASLDFVTSWGFKTATVFGASLGIIGYWCAAVFHTSDPSLAMLLMGVPGKGVATSFALSVSTMWYVGTGGAMSLGALAGVFYLSRGRATISLGSSEQRVLRIFLPLLLVLLAIGTYGVILAGESYPQQSVLAIGVLIGGYLIFEAVRRYSLGQVRLYVPALAFTIACYALLLYQASNTEWYNAAAVGGISWPLIGFPLLAVTVYYFTTRWNEMKYWLPVTVAVMVLLIITVKVADVALVRGSKIVALDSRFTAAVQSWSVQTGIDLTFLDQTYPLPANSELFLGLLLSFLIFLGVFYLFEKSLSPRVQLAIERNQATNEVQK